LKILVTGAAGFVGSTLAKRLVDDGHSVVGVDSLTDYYDVALKMQNLARIPAGDFEFINEDLNFMDLEALLRDIEVVFHEAGQPGVRKSWGTDFGIYTVANVDATQRLLEAARSAPHLKRLVYASSSSVYGNAERYPTTEMDRPEPVSPYGVTKLAAEHLCSLYASNFGVPTVSLRYFTVYGPRQRPDMAFTRFTRAALSGDEISIFGDGEQIRDFTFVDDVVEANVRAAFVESVPGSVYNVSGGSSISVNGVLEILERLNSRPLNVRHLRGVAGDVFRTGGDTTAIRRDLGWEASIPLEVGLGRQLEWARETDEWLRSIEPVAS
jgi:UDP-glucuronate 4-epimerase